MWKYIKENQIVININKFDKFGRSALSTLSITYEKENFEIIIKYLVDHGITLNNITEKGYTVLMKTCRCGHLNITRYVISKRTGLSLFNELEKSALTIAYKYHYYDILQFLMDYLINTSDHRNILNSLSSVLNGQNYFEIVEYLIDHRISVNFIGNYGNSLLMKVCVKGYFYESKIFSI